MSNDQVSATSNNASRQIGETGHCSMLVDLQVSLNSGFANQSLDNPTAQAIRMNAL